MTLKNIFDIMLKEESDPQFVASKLNKKAENWSQWSNNEIQNILNMIYNEIKNNKIPIGNGNFIDINNHKDLENYINNIKSNLIIDNKTAKQAILNSLDSFLIKLKK